MPQARHSQKLKRFCKFICGPVLPLSLASGVALLFLTFFSSTLAAAPDSQSLLEKELSDASGVSEDSLLGILQNKVDLFSYLAQVVRVPVPSDNPKKVPGGDTDYLYLVPPQILVDSKTEKLYATNTTSIYFASGKSISQQKADYIQKRIEKQLIDLLADKGPLKMEIKRILLQQKQFSSLDPKKLSFWSLFPSFLEKAQADDSVNSLSEDRKKEIIQKLIVSNDPAIQQEFDLLMLNLVYNNALPGGANLTKETCREQGDSWINNQCQKNPEIISTITASNDNTDNFADEDEDGVANSEDKCPGSSKWEIVNKVGNGPVRGCDCDQIEAMGLSRKESPCLKSQCEGKYWVEYPEFGQNECSKGVISARDCSPKSRVVSQDCLNSQNKNNNSSENKETKNFLAANLLEDLAKSILNGDENPGTGGNPIAQLSSEETNGVNPSSFNPIAQLPPQESVGSSDSSSSSAGTGWENNNSAGEPSSTALPLDASMNVVPGSDNENTNKDDPMHCVKKKFGDCHDTPTGIAAVTGAFLGLSALLGTLPMAEGGALLPGALETTGVGGAGGGAVSP